MMNILHAFETAKHCPRPTGRDLPKSIEVSLDFGGTHPPIAVGRLDWDAQRRHAAMVWDPVFAASPLPLSPLSLRDHSKPLRPCKGWAFEGLPGPIGDSLPDGWGRLIFDREIRARGGSVRQTTGLDRLAMIGEYGMGALVFRPPRNVHAPKEFSLDWFAKTVPEVDEGATTETLTQMRHVLGGAQGSRPKFVAQLSKDGTRLRGHRAKLTRGWRHVLIKRRAAPSDPNGTAEAEAAYMLMARAAGIDTAWTDLLTSSTGERFFVTERFDRTKTGRLHMQTAAALLNLDFRTAKLDYIELMKLSKALTGNRQAAVEMLRRAIFNARAVNRADHLKNHAFLMGANGVWKLSPAYDLTYSLGPAGRHSVKMAGNATTPGIQAFCDLGRIVGLNPLQVRQMVDRVDAAVDRWDEFASLCRVPPILRNTIQGDMDRARTWI